MFDNTKVFSIYVYIGVVGGVVLLDIESSEHRTSAHSRLHFSSPFLNQTGYQLTYAFKVEEVMGHGTYQKRIVVENQAPRTTEAIVSLAHADL